MAHLKMTPEQLEFLKVKAATKTPISSIWNCWAAQWPTSEGFTPEGVRGRVVSRVKHLRAEMKAHPLTAALEAPACQEAASTPPGPLPDAVPPAASDLAQREDTLQKYLDTVDDITSLIAESQPSAAYKSDAQEKIGDDAPPIPPLTYLSTEPLDMSLILSVLRTLAEAQAQVVAQVLELGKSVASLTDAVTVMATGQADSLAAKDAELSMARDYIAHLKRQTGVA